MNFLPVSCDQKKKTADKQLLCGWSDSNATLFRVLELHMVKDLEKYI
jgi:hypothetical protein